MFILPNMVKRGFDPWLYQRLRTRSSDRVRPAPGRIKSLGFFLCHMWRMMSITASHHRHWGKYFKESKGHRRKEGIKGWGACHVNVYAMRVPCARTHGLGGKDTLLHDITFHQMTSLVPSIRQHKMYFEMNVHLGMDPLALAVGLRWKRTGWSERLRPAKPLLETMFKMICSTATVTINRRYITIM